MKNLLLMLVGSLILCSCGDAHNDEAKPHNEAANIENHHHHDHDNHSAETIELNSGEKWRINDEMKPFILKGEDLVNSYIQDKKDNYKELYGQLEEQNGNLVESCTMDGKSHDELHKWLHPHLELTEGLAKAENAEQAKEIIVKIQNSYQIFRQYFN